MTTTYWEEFKCDICGKVVKREGHFDNYPDGWNWLSPTDNREGWDVCEGCSKKTFLVAVNLSMKDNIGNGSQWLVKQTDIEALAAGVPADDIFV